MSDTAAVIVLLNRRFYALCARLGIVPPIGPAGPDAITSRKGRKN